MHPFRRLIVIVESNLPMDTAARMARAKKLGFTIKAYHGTGADFSAFSLAKGNVHSGGGYAPMFADRPGEASGYADNVDNGSVLPVLLRLKRPFIVSTDRTVSDAEFKKLTGGLPNVWHDDKDSTRDVMDTLYRNFTRTTKRTKKQAWIAIYRHFKKLGYDGFLFPDVLSDYDEHHATFTKYVVFNIKNIRSIHAAFDPAKSSSADLLA